MPSKESFSLAARMVPSSKTSGKPCRSVGYGFPREKLRLSGAGKKSLSRHAEREGVGTRQLTVKPQLPLSFSRSDELIPGELPNTTENIWLDIRRAGAKLFPAAAVLCR